jgi:hypothetical protein
MNRSRYIKPSVLQLEYSTDEDVVSLGTCKSTNSSQLQSFPALGSPPFSSCSASTCSSVHDS